jgi:hypothetical protein
MENHKTKGGQEIWARVLKCMAAQGDESDGWRKREIAQNVERALSAILDAKGPNQETVMHAMAKNLPNAFQYAITKMKWAKPLAMKPDERGRNAFEHHLAHVKAASRGGGAALYSKKSKTFEKDMSDVEINWLHALEVALEKNVYHSVMLVGPESFLKTISFLPWKETTKEEHLGALLTPRGANVLKMVADRHGTESHEAGGHYVNNCWNIELEKWLPPMDQKNLPHGFGRWYWAHWVSKTCPSCRGHDGYRSGMSLPSGVELKEALTIVCQAFLRECFVDGLDWQKEWERMASKMNRPIQSWMPRAPSVQYRGTIETKWVEETIGPMHQHAGVVEKEVLSSRVGTPEEPSKKRKSVL